MSAPTLPKELDQPVPRLVKTTVGFKIFILIITGAALALIGLVAGLTYLSSVTKEILHERGVYTSGTIINLHTEPGGHHRNYYADYRFSVPNGRRLLQFHSQYGVAQIDYFRLSIGQTVPIVYDPESPFTSAIDFADQIRRFDRPREIRIAMAKTAEFVSAIYLIVLIASFSLHIREYRLLKWGIVSSARIVTIAQASTKTDVSTTITYDYMDKEGNLYEGISGSLPPKNYLPVWSREQYSFDVTESPIVLYDPHNHGRRLFYARQRATCYLTK